MTNREKYKQAFSVLHSSGNSPLEVEKMADFKRKQKLKTVAAAALCVLLVGGTGTAYAANLGGIQRIVQVWMEGDRTDAVMEVMPDGSYNLTMEDESGNVTERSGGGVAINPDGSERPLTAEELLEQVNAPDVEYKEDGSVWVYYYGQKIDITDKFEDGICYVKLENEGETLYMTVKYNDGYSTSPNRYPSPRSFN